MIDQVSLDGAGWARFSGDMKRRYRLGRILDPSVRLAFELGCIIGYTGMYDLRVVTFVLINPSTADAFKPDPTVSNCVKFAQRWGAHVLEVVNLYTFRSPYPEDLDVTPPEDLGIDRVADLQIISACTGVHRVVAGWGNHGHRHDRGAAVRRLLADHQIPLLHLGLTKHGNPTHPLARGKSRIPIDREPLLWEAACSA